MATPAMRRSIRRWLPFVAALAAITAVSLSSSVMQWWNVQSTPATSSLPSVANSVLASRPNTSNADVHVVLWFVATLALVWAMRQRSRRALAVAAVALWACTGVVEFGQHWVSARTSQWTDVVANGLGIAAGLVVGTGAIAAWRRVRGRAPQPDGTQKRSGWSARSGAT